MYREREMYTHTYTYTYIWGGPSARHARPFSRGWAENDRNTVLETGCTQSAAPDFDQSGPRPLKILTASSF